MKKTIPIFSVLLLAVLAASVTSCKPNVDPLYSYRITGQFAEWTSNYDRKFMMEPVAKSDPRIKSMSKALSGAQYIYIKEYFPNRAGPAGWNVEYPGAGIRQDGIFAVKFNRLIADPSDRDGWAADAWMPSTEAPNFRSSLTPETIYVPLDRSDEAADAAGDGLGSVNSNPVLLKGAKPYYIVLAIFKDGTRGIGAVLKPE